MRTLDKARILVFGDVRIFEGDPVNAVQIDAVIVGENAADPCSRRYCVRTDAN